MSPAVEVHRRLLERWRTAMDLVGPGPVDSHFDDAMAVAGLLSPRGRWLDLGAGAGFPGVALAASHPAAEFTLVERRQKRAAFLREVIHAAGLANARVFEGDAATLPAAEWDGVTSRAYKPPEAYLADARRLLRPGGIAALLTTGELPEVDEMMVVSRHEYIVDGRARLLAIYRRD
ncbi:MAG: class I SAM-dependent methyltransferase [Deltaproteobacteria bacterium]|nr:class I SAM-dependent methyltransferase [Deltaproteobacteria bacterium]